MFDILTSEQIAAIVATNGPETQLATKELVETMRSKAMLTKQQQPIVYLEVGMEGAIALLGIRQSNEGEIPYFHTGKKENRVGWVCDWNSGNRCLIAGNEAKIFRAMIQGRFVPTPETAIFLDDGMCGSAQHRLIQIFKICIESNPEYTAVLAVSFGFSAELADVLDRAARRSKAAISQRNNIIDESNFVDESGEKLVSDVQGAIATCNRELVTMLGIVDKRATGRDVKASGEFDEAAFGHMLQRCPGAAELLVTLYIHGKGADGKDTQLVKHFGRPTIGAMLILSANTDNPAEWEASESGRSRVWTLPEVIHMPDESVVRGFLEVGAGNTESSPFYVVFKTLSSKSFKKHPQRKASMCNALLRHFLKTRQLIEQPIPTDAATGQPLPGATAKTVWTCEQVADTKQVDNGVPQTKGDDGAVPPPYKWFNFGGLDCGYLPPLTK